MRAGETLKAEHIGGRIADIVITKSEKIANGQMGNIYRIEGMLGRKKIHTIVKDYTRSLLLHDTDEKRTPTELIDHAVAMHALVKGLGVPTWKTLRKTDKEGVLLLSEGEKSDATTLVTQTGESNRAEGVYQKVHTISNFAESVSRALSYAMKLAENGIKVPPDAWMFSFTKTDEWVASLDIYIGDFDSMEVSTSETALDLDAYNRYALECEMFNILLMVAPGDSFHKEAKKVRPVFDHFWEFDDE